MYAARSVIVHDDEIVLPDQLVSVRRPPGDWIALKVPR
jgi:hypothetical protein